MILIKLIFSLALVITLLFIFVYIIDDYLNLFHPTKRRYMKKRKEDKLGSSLCKNCKYKGFIHLTDGSMYFECKITKNNYCEYDSCEWFKERKLLKFNGDKG